MFLSKILFLQQILLFHFFSLHIEIEIPRPHFLGLHINDPESVSDGWLPIPFVQTTRTMRRIFCGLFNLVSRSPLVRKSVSAPDGNVRNAMETTPEPYS